MINELTFRYMYDNEYTKTLRNFLSETFFSESPLKIEVIENGYILPRRISDELAWGRGGVVNERLELVVDSTIPGAFGGTYDFEINNVDFCNEEVFFIPVYIDHWGHFLIDVISRLWFLKEEKYQNFKIYYCDCSKSKKIDGNFLKCIDALGIRNQLFVVDEIKKFKKIYIPQRSMGFDISYHREYVEIIDMLLNNLCISKKYENEKIYFTRTKFMKAKFHEVGEKQIEYNFKKNGYRILSPEKLSLEDQISCFRNANEIVSLSGTIPHNLIFAHNGLKYIILNRQPIVNKPQLRINNIRNVNVFYLDVYNKIELKKITPYGKGILKFELTEELFKFFQDNNLKFFTKSKMKIFFENIIYRFLCLIERFM